MGSATVEATDLMARTVYLKVAHHGSQNATLEKRGLDLMTSSDLSAFVPTSQKDAQKVGWGKMPYNAILTALAEKDERPRHPRRRRVDRKEGRQRPASHGLPARSGRYVAPFATQPAAKAVFGWKSISLDTDDDRRGKLM